MSEHYCIPCYLRGHRLSGVIVDSAIAPDPETTVEECRCFMGHRFRVEFREGRRITMMEPAT